MNEKQVKTKLKDINGGFLDSFRKITNKTDELQKMQKELEEIYSDLDFHMNEIYMISKKWMGDKTQNITPERKQENIEQNDTDVQNTDVVSLQKQVDEINKEIKEGDQAINFFETSLDEIKNQLNSSPNKVLNINKIVGLLQAELQEKQEELDRVNASLNAKNEIIKKFSKIKVSEDLGSSNDFKDKYNNLKKKFDQLSKEHDELLKLAVGRLTEENEL